MSALEAAVRLTQAWLQGYEGKGTVRHEDAAKAFKDIYSTVLKALSEG